VAGRRVGGLMTVVGAAVILGLIVVLMVRFKIVRLTAALVCVVFGLVLGATPIGDAVNRGLSQVGGWLAAQVRAL
jgi:hypothetical protein